MLLTISPIYLWLGVLVVCLAAEACTTQLVTIWFAIGSIGAIAAAAMGFGPSVQIGVCLIVSVILLLLLRPLVRGRLATPVSRTNADRILEQTAVVVQTIDKKQGTGQIRLMGQVWSAAADNPAECIAEGETVVVTAISGVKAIVRRAGEQESVSVR